MSRETAWMFAAVCGVCAGINSAFIPVVPFAAAGAMFCVVGMLFYIHLATAK